MQWMALWKENWLRKISVIACRFAQTGLDATDGFALGTGGVLSAVREAGGGMVLHSHGDPGRRDEAAGGPEGWGRRERVDS